ncbi:hypothetical protein [Leifsonia poae]|uniref:Uncharacterized protein n=1 Tax=Leifsonia poae TaxID=110933 RepID=A0A9W6HAZ8_9MICO|nr:hypothetical protein [Leifsonia poae]GLJ76523.1 hypothetical protein GCM10017584_20970 [Leifsonia poae]
MKHWIRVTLTTLTSTIGLTAIAGGTALLVGSFANEESEAIVPDRAFLGDSPFTSYVVPGVLLAVVVGGTHLAAAVLVGRRASAAPVAVAVAGFGLLIWIFVQMMFIPFSVLQALYFAGGLAELGLLMLGLGLFTPARTTARVSGGR